MPDCQEFSNASFGASIPSESLLIFFFSSSENLASLVVVLYSSLSGIDNGSSFALTNTAGLL